MPANEIKLEVYTFKIRNKKNKEDFEIISDFFGKNFKSFVQEFFKAYESKNHIDDKLKRSFKIPKGLSDYNVSGKMVSGIINAGDYGISSEIQKQDGTIKAKKNKEDLDVKQFYFLIKVIDKSPVGVIMLQRTGIYGISSIFQEIFKSFFEEQYIDHRIFINQFISEAVAKDVVKNGLVKELEIVRYAKSSDEVDWLHEFVNSDGKLKIKVSITAERSSFPLGWSNDAANFMSDKTASFFDVSNLSDLGFTEENSTMSIRVKGADNRSHKIDLENGSIKPYYNIDEDVKKDNATQLPVFSSIDEIAKGILKDIIKNV